MVTNHKITTIFASIVMIAIGVVLLAITPTQELDTNTLFLGSVLPIMGLATLLMSLGEKNKRGKLFLIGVMLGCIVFIFGGWYFLFVYDYGIPHTGRLHPGPISGRIIGALGVLLGAAGLLILINKRLFNGGRSRVAIDDKGLTIDNELIEWAKIERVRTWHVNQTSGLYIQTTDSQERIAKARSIKKWMMKFNYRMYGAVISIGEMDYPTPDFKSQCIKHIKKR